MRDGMMGMNRRVRAASLAFLLAAASVPGFASDYAEQGQKLFMENRPQEAVAVLEMAAKETGADEKTHLYLGIAYQQLGRWDDAVTAFRRGLSSAVLYRHLFLFNIANSFYAQGRNAFAIEYYDQAIAAKGDYAAAFLNRANARMRLSDYAGAIGDYSLYLSMDPGSGQAAEIRRLLDLLGAKAAEAELLKAQAEAQRLAEEAAKQALLDAVAQSLLQAAEETTSLSAGSGDVQGYDSDLSLDD